MTDSKRKESDLIGNILHDDATEAVPLSTTSMQAYGYIRSTSAPPPGLNDLKQNDAQPSNPLLLSREYYNYYYSQKPLDPRLPKPLWKPGMAAEIFQEPLNDGIELAEKETEEEENGFGSTGQEQMLGSNEMNITQNAVPLKKEQENSQKYQNQQTYQQYNQSQSFQQSYTKPKNTFNYSGGGGQQQPTQFNQTFNQFPMQYPGQQVGFVQPGMQMGMNMNMFPKPFYQPNYPYQQPMFPNYQPQMQNQMGYTSIPNMYSQGFQASGPNSYMFQGNMGGQQKFQDGPSKNYQQKSQYPNNYNQNQFNTGGNMQGKRNNQNFYQDSSYKNSNRGDKNFQKGGFGGNFRKNQGNQNNAPKLDINEVMQRIVENCQDQNGSRMIQQHFESATSEDRDLIFGKVLPESLRLAKNVFGNYVIQKILEKGTKEQKVELFATFEGEVYNLTIDVYGCRVIQRALEEFKNDSQAQQKIISELKDRILECIESENGNHVIQKMFGVVPHEYLDFVIKTAVNNLKSLPFHPYGCRVIQKILETEPETKVVPIIEKLIENCVKLFEDQYGNYIMQYIIEKGPSVQKNILFKIIKDNFITLSFNKFASNVTEKSVIFGAMDFRKEVLSVLLSYNGNPNEQPLFRLMNHEYGNYVIQRLFECGDDTIKVQMYERIKTYDFTEIRRNQYGKHVLSFIEKQMDDNQKF